MSDEPTEDQGSAAAEGANVPLRRAAAHAREIVVPDPDSVMDDLNEILPWMDGVPKIVACSEGWHPLILLLHNRLVGIDPDYRVLQVKEKLGGLRYYIQPSQGLDEVLYRRLFDVEDEAEAESFHICEVCGQPGQLRGGSWYRTLCDLHDEEREARYAALAETAGDDTEDLETVQDELSEVRHEVAQRRSPPQGE